ncbi:MAG: hypothetical protein IJ237_11050 [Oscillospiraceae bacterium]|nr:hypothetical protein [Oscillospiraceae bacterium]
MNYEEFYESLALKEKELRDATNGAAKAYKAIAKNTETGNLPELKKALSLLAESTAKIEQQHADLSGIVGSFDTKTYFISGDFTRQMLDACEAAGIDVKGEKGVYEMFPYKVRIVGDEEHAEEVWINRKKFPSVRPKALAEYIRAEREKLYKASFNESAFMNELADAYDTTCLKNGVRIGSTQRLTVIYKTMTPMARARKEYDFQAFAFDLARLYELGAEKWITKSGRRFVFGTSRDPKNAVRVLSSTGVEDYIVNIKALQMEAEEG